ncbi:MAG: agmatinase, partial [Candidatus Thermoplasmatota archaeon]|nr:agmatinase [Candidatus Thermoplasmatota archaeon]
GDGEAEDHPRLTTLYDGHREGEERVSMEFPDYFADADAAFSDASFVVFGVPYEKTSSFRHGADKAPGEVRQASWNFEQYDLRLGVDAKQLKVHDYGNLDVGHLTSQQLFERTKTFTAELIAKKKIPLAIGGDHSITPGIVSAFPEDIGVLSLDAHMDFRQQYKNDRFNHACVLRRIADHLPVKHMAVLGIRSAEKDEYDQAVEQGLFFKDAFTVHSKGIAPSIKETRAVLKGKPVYLTIDIDVVDPAYAPGTSTPEPFGVTPLQVVEIIEAFAPQLVGCDVVEVCPPYDHGQTAVLAARLLKTCMAAMWKHQKGLH